MLNTLPKAVDAPLQDWQSAVAGTVSYYADTTAAGRPLLLLHSINAAPSTYEMKPLFEHYQGERPVYAPDLPGFGHSERADRAYDAEFFASTICEFLDQVIGEPADVIALSTTAEFAARAALTSDKVHSLVLISPTGFTPRNPPGRKTQKRLLSFFQTPVLGSTLYSLLTIKPSVRYFLNMGFAGSPPKDLVDYAHRTTNQPGARYAPFHFLSMGLFTPDAVNDLYRNVAVPTLVLYDKDPNISFERLPEILTDCANWKAVRIRPTLGLPHWEEPEKTTAALDAFWRAGG